MMKTTIAAFGGLALLTATALASPAQNDIGAPGMGGGTYDNAAPSAQSPGASGYHEVGGSDEGEGVYRVPGAPVRG